MSHDISALETKVRTLGDAISKVSDAKHAELLSQIIRKPGWTTVRENELVHAHLDAFHNQVGNLHKGLDALITIARKIGEK
jgi:Protein of unknown function (DUF3421)